MFVQVSHHLWWFVGWVLPSTGYPARMTTRDVWAQGMTQVLRYDDQARTVATLDPDGVLLDTRPYTDAENAALDAQTAAQALQVEHDTTKVRVDAIIEDLKAEKDRAQVVIDKPNAQITAADTKDLARAVKRLADANIDLAKYAAGR